jgi:hypothetical protein
MQPTIVDVVEVVTGVVDVTGEVDEVVDESHQACQNVLSVETHRRAATGNTRSREASGTAGGSRSLGQRPRSPAHALAW